MGRDTVSFTCVNNRDSQLLTDIIYAHTNSASYPRRVVNGNGGNGSYT